MEENEKEMSKVKLSGLFLLMTGLFCGIGGGYFFYDFNTNHDDQSLDIAKTLGGIALGMILIGAFLMSGLLEPVEVKPQSKNEQNIQSQKTDEGLSVPRIVYLMLIPFGVWLFLQFIAPMVAIKVLGPDTRMPAFNFSGFGGDVEDFDKDEMRRAQEDENAVTIGGE